MRVRQQSTATYAIPLYMVLSSDHVSAATGKTVSVTLSKNGGAFAAASGAVTELSSGVYSLAGNATDSNTLGSLTILATATGCDPYLVEYTVVPYNPFDAVRLGLTALPNAAAEAAGGLYTRGTGAGQINQPANGRIDVNTIALSGTTQTARDIGASVLLSSGTGTGQLDFTSGVVKANLAQILGTALTETAGQIAAAFKQFFDVASPTGTMKAITAVTTVTNLTNAPTAGDFTATMKTSLNAATPASVTGAVGSVTGNVGGNVVGSVGSVTAGVTVTTNNDKTGYALSSAGVQAIWDALTSALSTASSIGKLLVDNINATISSRLASASYTAPPTAAANADAVWDEAIAGHLSAGSTGEALNAAGSAGDPWTTTLPGAYGAGSAGYIVGTNVNATISSRSTLDGTGVQSALTSQGYTTTRAGYLDTLNGLVQAVWDKATSAITTVGSIGKQIKDNLDTTISSRMATFTYTTPPTVTEIRQEMDSNSTKLANLDAAVTTRLASASYTAPLNSTQTAQAVLNATASSYNTASTIGEKINSASAPSAAAVADAVWDEAISGHLTAGTTGAKLNSAAAAGDPWSTALPGSYASGEAGNILAAIKTKTDVISGSSITVTSPIVEGADITIVRGDDYANADGRALFATTTFSNAPSLTGGSVTLKVQTGATTTFSKAGVVTGAAACYVELTDAETAALTGKRSYDLEATLSNGDVVTIAQGKLEVLKDVR